MSSTFPEIETNPAETLSQALLRHFGDRALQVAVMQADLSTDEAMRATWLGIVAELSLTLGVETPPRPDER